MTSEATALRGPAASLADDDFSLFGLPRRHALDRADIDARWKALQAQVHPDRFVSEGSAAQQMALQWVLRVNEAYQRLKDPIARGAYLCELNGHDVNASRALPPSFLMQQMAWREALEEAGGPAALEMLADEVADRRAALLRELAERIDTRQDWPAATGCVQALMFIAKFSADLNERLDG
ncbi:Fe-S protein assembly co-chaperone HscB [Roseateles cellulosilyticus]|uniref:Co-chaperone protein HscB homolog n=1 Tax=Pelomonas cellulosilytica TaxID=2906762 RepID=A0ABS8XXZ2_9BURK|nr:Fe-S protein assembly co-chaperone HscB [Pelomonas sp. P8]MCE4556808.1 Fe-S protein assembly co-chaperone HscB [Pelomonas sp. P8]